jgi:hypothetical protein
VAISSPTSTLYHVFDADDRATELGEAIKDFMSVKDHDAASRRLVEKLVSFSSGTVDILEIGQVPLRLTQADGACPQHRLHLQGMEVDRETGLLYITAVEMIQERDKTDCPGGRGRAHLFECNIEGRTLRSLTLASNNEDEYHPSGMVLVDGTMFIALAQYLPETSATIIKFNVRDWTYERLFQIQDHVGLVVPNPSEGELLLGTWGSRHYYCTDLKGNIKSKRRTPSSDDIEHQDGQLIDGNTVGIKLDSARGEPPMMLVTGVTAGGMEHFGLEIVDIANWTIKTSLRWASAPHITKGGWAPFVNPTFLWVDSDDRVLALATPDDAHEQASMSSTLILYTLKRRE